MKTIAQPHRSPNRGGAIAKILIILVLIGVVSVVAWVMFLPKVTASVIEKRTGFALTSDSFSVNPLGGAFKAENLRVLNPHTFPSPDFVAFRSLNADVDLPSLMSDQIVINSATVDVETLALIRAIDGTLNAKLFTDRLKGDAPPPEPSTEPKPEKQFLIKNLEVRVSKMRVENHTGQKPSIREFNVNFSQRYQDVTDLKQLATGPALMSLANVAAAVVDISPADVSRLIETKGKSANELLKGLGGKAKDALKSSVDTLEETRKP